MFTRNRDATDLRDREDVRDDEVRNDEVVEETSSRTAWSPAQFVAGIIGIAAIAFGAIALAKTGLNTDTLYHPHKTVLGFSHTPLLALAEIGFGVLMLLSALTVGGRSFMALLSAAAIGLGIVVVADWWNARLYHWLGVTDRNGWMFIIVGAIGLVAAVLFPTVVSGGRTHVRHVRSAS
jgi:hypothetical protein